MQTRLTGSEFFYTLDVTVGDSSAIFANRIRPIVFVSADWIASHSPTLPRFTTPTIVPCATFQYEQILINSIRSSLIPRLARSKLRRNGGDVFAQLRIQDRPGITQMLLQ